MQDFFYLLYRGLLPLLFFMVSRTAFVASGYMLIKCDRIIAAVGERSPGRKTEMARDGFSGM